MSDEARKFDTEYARILATGKTSESGPGISEVPVKSEALSFTLEDLLCEDA